MNELPNLRIMSKISSEGLVQLWLEEIKLPPPASDEVVIEVQAAPVNPADMLQLLGPADLSTLEESGTQSRPRLSARIPVDRMALVAGRVDRSVTTGNEGAGQVVRAGAEAAHLVGRVVALRDGMYSRMRLAKVSECMVMPIGTTGREAAAASINPLTALGMIETMHREGHRALIHTAAASSVGQMLNRLCIADGISIVNVVRSSTQAEILRQLGATHIVDSTGPDFRTELQHCIGETGATLAFDAIGGGRMAGDILAAMEAVMSQRATLWSRYGTRTLKQVYIYGVLNPGPKLIEGNVGTAWAVGGWLMSWFMESIEPDSSARLRNRVASEITTTFASHFHQEMSLQQALQAESMMTFSRNETGGKILLTPQRTG